MLGMGAALKGTRLAFVVRKLEGEVVREKVDFKTTKVKGSKNDRHEMEKKLVSEDAGYMVYFPRGHAIRCKDKATLARFGLDKEPELVNLEGLHDPNSPAGKLFLAQDKESRMSAFRDLEQQVIDLVHRRSGSHLLATGMEA